MYSSPRSTWSRWSDRSWSSERRPYTPRGESSDRGTRTFRDRNSGGGDRGWYTPRTDWAERRPYTPRGESSDRGGDRAPRTFDRKPYAGRPLAAGRGTGARPSTDRAMDPRQMRYQVIGRTTDDSDLIVQISPAFYEYVRSMAHQWVKPVRVEEPRYNDRSEGRSDDKPRYSKFDHPYHKEEMQTSYEKAEKKPYTPKPKTIESWDDESIDVEAIDSEMDDEYEMIKQWFAKLKEKDTKPKRTVRSNNVKKK